MFFNRVLETVHIAFGTHALYHYLINMDLRGALEADIIWYAVRRRKSVNLTEYLSFQELQGANFPSFNYTSLKFSLHYQLQVVIKVSSCHILNLSYLNGC